MPFTLFSIPLEINTEDGIKTVQVNENFILEKRRFYIEQNMGIWLVLEVSYFENNKWTEWKKLTEFPQRGIVSNRDLENILLKTLQYSEEVDELVYVPIKNENNLMVWWEERKYINFLRRIYTRIKNIVNKAKPAFNKR